MLDPYLYTMDWLCHNNHTENQDQKIEGMRASMNTISMSINIQMCTSIEDIWAAICEDIHLQELKPYIIQSWPSEKEEAVHDISKYWAIKNKLAMLDGIMM